MCDRDYAIGPGDKMWYKYGSYACGDGTTYASFVSGRDMDIISCHVIYDMIRYFIKLFGMVLDIRVRSVI